MARLSVEQGIESLRLMPGSGMAGSHGRSTSAFGVFSTLVSSLVAPVCNPTHRKEGSHFPTPTPVFIICCFLLTPLTGVRGNLKVVLIAFSLLLRMLDTFKDIP